MGKCAKADIENYFIHPHLSASLLFRKNFSNEYSRSDVKEDVILYQTLLCLTPSLRIAVELADDRARFNFGLTLALLLRF